MKLYLTRQYNTVDPVRNGHLCLMYSRVFYFSNKTREIYNVICIIKATIAQKSGEISNITDLHQRQIQGGNTVRSSVRASHPLGTLRIHF